MEIKNLHFDIKEVSEEGTIEGYASTFGGKPDSYGDIIVAGAFEDTLKKGGRNGTGIPLLWQHNFDEPLGRFTQISENKKGLKVTAELVLEVQKAKEAHVLAKKNIINAFSIGWDLARDDKGRALEGSYTYDSEKGIRYLKLIDLWEVSMVTFPANTNATIDKVKSLFADGATVRQIEQGLKDVGLSCAAAKFIISKFDKSKLFRDEKVFEKELLGLVEQAFRKPNSFEEELLNTINQL